MEKIAVIDSWTETESGWGCRPDGASLHLTKEDYNSYVEKYWKELKERHGESTPNEYSHPDEDLKVVRVSDELYEKIEKSEGGLMLWNTKYNKLKKGGQIEYII